MLACCDQIYWDQFVTIAGKQKREKNLSSWDTGKRPIVSSFRHPNTSLIPLSTSAHVHRSLWNWGQESIGSRNTVDYFVKNDLSH